MDFITALYIAGFIIGIQILGLAFQLLVNWLIDNYSVKDDGGNYDHRRDG